MYVAGLLRFLRQIVIVVLVFSGIFSLSQISVSAQTGNQNVTLAWNASDDLSVVGYKVYYGASSSVYTNSITVGNVTTATISNLVAGVTYYFVVTAFNGSGIESLPSNEVSYTVPTPPNTPPTLDSPGNLAINEDAALQTISLTGITPGVPGENQTVSISASSSNTGLIPTPTVLYSNPNTTGTLRFTPAPNAFGTATITVTVNDGQPSNNIVTRSFIVTVNPVNDSPTLNAVANLAILEDAGLQTVNLSGISFGPANEMQTLVITATSSNPGVIPHPTVNYTNPNSTGSLTFTPVANASGSATITVTADDGQAVGNTITRTFTVTVTSVNDLPTLNALSNLNLNEDAGAQTVNLSGITSGAANESQTLTVTAVSSNPGLVPNPTVSYVSPNTTGTLAFAPVANASGSATITVTVNDGAATNNTIARTFVVNVSSLNDPPTLNNLNNLSINEDAGLQTVSLSGISTGATNETQTLVVTAVSSDPSVVPNPTVNYTSPSATGTLTFTPVANAFGTATVTVTVNDGQATSNTVVRTFTVTVNAVNDPPTLAALSNVSIDEDAGQQTVILSGISGGPANENQNVTLTATSSNPGLVPAPTVSYASPNPTGSLTFTPVANESGTATISVTVNDGQASSNTFVRTFIVTVNAVNDPPTLNPLSDLALEEDSGLQTVSLTGISSGAANETQTLTITATSSNPGLIPNPTITYTSPGSTGTLRFTPVANVSGVATITVTVNDGQSQNNTVVRTFTVSISDLNDPPTLNTIANLTLNEDAGLQTVNLAGISSGATNENQTLTVTATSSNPALIPNPTVNYVSPNATGTLTFTPVANEFGVATITVVVNDGQLVANTVTRTFTVTVNAVNDPPSLNPLSNVTVLEDAGPQTVDLSGISFGPDNESQTVTVSATSSNPTLIPTPSVNYLTPNATGVLTFAPGANASGSATITVTVSDGQASAGTTTRTFTVTVLSVNDVPTLNPLSDLSINEDSGQQTVSLSGIGSGAPNESQPLTVSATSSNPGLIPTPAITYTSPNSTGTLRFTPIANATGSAVVTVTVNDGQASNNIVSRTFTVNVGDVNDLPTLNALGNVTVLEDAAQQTVNLSGITSGSSNEVETLTIVATSSNPGLIPTPVVTYSSPSVTGSLTFTPVANAFGTATITVTVSDTDGSTSRSFNVTVNPVNDAPVFNTLPNISIDEDAAAQTINLSGIGSGAANENQTLTITATSSNTGLIPSPAVNYVSPNTTGTLTLTPVANASGTATITVTLNDGQGSNNIVSRTFTVTVNSVNDSPTLNPIANVTIDEDAGVQTVNLSGISSGAPNENQTLSVTAVSSTPGLIPNPTVTYVSPNATGALSFTPVADAFGVATITVTVNDGQSSGNTFTRTFTVTVNAVNEQPTLNPLSDIELEEDAGVQTISLTGISSGSASENQVLVVTASSSNTGLVPHPTVNYTSPNGTGSLTLSPIANASGSAVISVTVNDGQSANNTIVRTFVVSVGNINDQPTMDQIANVTIPEDSGSYTVNITGVTSGSPSETQPLTVTAVSSNPNLIPAPVVTYTSPNSTGTLTFSPVQDATGTATITVSVNDGQVVNHTFSRTFTVTVTPVNDPPTINVLTNMTVSEDSGSHSVPLTGISAGGQGESQPITISAVSSNPSLIPNPTVTYTSPNATGTLNFTVAANSFGSATITVTLGDGQATNNTFSRSFTVTVAPVNDPPTLNPLGSILIHENAGQQSINLAGISTGMGNELQTLVVTATSSDTTLIPHPTIVYTSPSPTGTMRFTPVAGGSGVATLTVTVNDGGATNNTVTQTLVVTVNGRPKISPIPEQNVLTNTVVGPIQFTVSDAETPAAGILVAVTCSNPGLLPPADIILTGTGTNRTVTLTPALNASGTAEITITAHDGLVSSTLTFTVNVLRQPTPPTNLIIVTTEGAGTVSPNLSGAKLKAGQTYTLTATPSSGQLFEGWSGSVTSAKSKISVRAGTNTMLLKAKFIPNPFTPIRGTYRGLFYENEQVSLTTSGSFAVSIGGSGAYSGRIMIGRVSHSFSGKLSFGLRATNNIVRSGGPVQLILQIDGNDKLSGTLTHIDWTASLHADRAVFNSRTNPAPFAGTYTLIVPGTDADPAIPGGHGYGKVRVTTSGQIQFSGVLPDGAKVTQGAVISKEGFWPVYVPLYSGKGSLVSWQEFQNRDFDDIHGRLSWIKTPNTAVAAYRNGFTNSYEVVGSAFVRTPGVKLLNIEVGELAFSGGTLGNGFTNYFNLAANNSLVNLSTNKLKVSIWSTNGFFKGVVVHPETKRTLSLAGAILQKQNAGYGFLLSTNLSSQVTLTPIP